MSQSDSRIGGVYTLASIPGCSVNIDSDIVWIQIHLNIVDLRKHSHRCSRCVYPAAGFRLRYSLYSMSAALILKSRIRSLSFYEDYSFFYPSQSCIVYLHHLSLPVLSFRIPGIHPEKIRAKQRRLFTTCSGSYLQDNILFIVRIFRKQQYLELPFHRLDLFIQLGDLHLRQFTHLIIAFFEHLFCFRKIIFGFFVFLVFFYDRLHFTHLFYILLPYRLIVYYVGIRHFFRQFIVFFRYKIKFIEHSPLLFPCFLTLYYIRSVCKKKLFTSVSSSQICLYLQTCPALRWRRFLQA